MFSDVCLICLDDVPGKITYLLDCRLLFSFFFFIFYSVLAVLEKKGSVRFPFFRYSYAIK